MFFLFCFLEILKSLPENLITSTIALVNEVCRKIWSQKDFNKMQRLLTYILFRMPRPWIIEWPKLRLKLIWLASIELAGETLLLKVSLVCQVTPPRVLVFFSWWNCKEVADGPHSGEGKVIINLVNRWAAAAAASTSSSSVDEVLFLARLFTNIAHFVKWVGNDEVQVS